MSAVAGASGPAATDRETVLRADYGSAERVGSLLVIVLRRAAMFGEMPRILRYASDWNRAGHGKLVALVLVTREDASLATMFGDAIRARLARYASEFTGYVGAHCVVLEVEGFAAAAVRSARAGLMLIARPELPMHLCSQLDEGVAWVRERLPPSAPPSAELRALIDGMRSA